LDYQSQTAWNRKPHCRQRCRRDTSSALLVRVFTVLQSTLRHCGHRNRVKATTVVSFFLCVFFLLILQLNLKPLVYVDVFALLCSSVRSLQGMNLGEGPIGYLFVSSRLLTATLSRSAATRLDSCKITDRSQSEPLWPCFGNERLPVVFDVKTFAAKMAEVQIAQPAFHGELVDRKTPNGNIRTDRIGWLMLWQYT